MRGGWIYLWVVKQRATVRQTETNRKPDFGWAAEFLINLEGNVIKVADGSCVRQQGDRKLEQETLQVQADLEPTFCSHLKTLMVKSMRNSPSPLLYASDPDFLAAI